MKKLFVLAIATMLCVACSVEENTDTTEGTNLEVVLENYKGVFTTQDGQTRGALSVELSEDNLYATGSLALSTGEVIAISTDQITDLGNRKQITFTSSDLSFTMTTGEEEEIMEIETVTFRGAESSILVGQNTERAPLTSIVGSYTCPDCEAPLDNLGMETFNLMIASAGNSTITSQTTLGGTTYVGDATQSGCVSINAEQTTCNLTSGTTSGMVGTAFNPGGGPVTWSGTHTYNDGPSGANDCSTVSGTWSWASNTIGTVGGVFTSNPTGDCVAPPITIVSENFDNAIGTNPTSGYTVLDGSSMSAVEFSLAPNVDYFGRVSNSDFGGTIAIANVQGARFFGAADMDQSGNPNAIDSGSLNWLNLDVSSISTMKASALFADSSVDGARWDPASSVRVQYSTNNTTWTTFLAIESASASLNNQPTQIDTPPFDGVGDGAVITNTLTEHSSIDVNVSGINTISVRIVFEGLTAREEDIAIDNFTITGN